MIRRIDDFLAEWKYELEATTRMMRNLTAESLATPVSEGGRTLGRIAWHIALTTGEMTRHAGIVLAGNDEDPQPSDPAAIADRFEHDARVLLDGIGKQWSDAGLDEEVPMYGQQWKRGMVLGALLKHLAHHRGQMTVLMRQAGLKVPGVYGPAKEEWASMGLPAME